MIIYTPTAGTAGFAVKDLPPSHHQPHPHLLHHQLPLLCRLDDIDGLPLTPGLYPRFPLHQLRLSLSFHRSPLIPDGFTLRIISRRTLPTAFAVSEQSQKNNIGGLLFSLSLSKLLKQRMTSSSAIISGLLMKDRTRCTGYIRCSGG